MCVLYGRCPDSICPGCSLPAEPKQVTYKEKQDQQLANLLMKLKLPREVTIKDKRVQVRRA